jgi:DNA repair exonuclease SbcCD ATPase subunit
MNKNTRIEELETELKQRDEKVKELREDLHTAYELVDEMREAIENANTQTENWIDAFDMQLNDNGEWAWGDNWLHTLELLTEKYEKLVRQWNTFVPRYNTAIAPKNLGRPLNASEAQVQEVRRRHKAKESLRKIAMATNLSFATVRTIVGRINGTDRTARRRKELKRLEIDRLRAAEFRRRKKARAELPKRITENQKHRNELIKAAKGLGKNR